MWEDLIFKIVVAVLGTIFTSFGIPCFLKIGGKASESRKRNYFRTLVEAAEEMFGGKSGYVKDGYVFRNAKKKYQKKMDDEEINAYVKYAVKDLKDSNKEYKVQNEYQRKRYQEEKISQDKGGENYFYTNRKDSTSNIKRTKIK